MFKLPKDVKFQTASIKTQFEKIKVIANSDEKIYDKTYVMAIVNNRLVKFLKESLIYE